MANGGMANGGMANGEMANGGMPHEHGMLPVDDWANPPTIAARIFKDPESGWNLHVMTTNFTFNAAAAGYAYTIVRPGQLFGGPYDNNYYLGTLFQLDKDAETQGVELARGDTLLGDTLRSTLAEVTAQLMESGSALDLDFAVINQKGERPSVEQVRSQLSAL